MRSGIQEQHGFNENFMEVPLYYQIFSGERMFKRSYSFGINGFSASDLLTTLLFVSSIVIWPIMFYAFARAIKNRALQKNKPTSSMPHQKSQKKSIPDSSQKRIEACLAQSKKVSSHWADRSTDDLLYNEFLKKMIAENDDEQNKPSKHTMPMQDKTKKSPIKQRKHYRAAISENRWYPHETPKTTIKKNNKTVIHWDKNLPLYDPSGKLTTKIVYPLLKHNQPIGKYVYINTHLLEYLTLKYPLLKDRLLHVCQMGKTGISVAKGQKKQSGFVFKEWETKTFAKVRFSKTDERIFGQSIISKNGHTLFVLDGIRKHHSKKGFHNKHPIKYFSCDITEENQEQPKQK